MKITGFGNNELLYLWDELSEKYPGINTFIVSEGDKGDYYITATKLIEFRNQQEKPLLVLIPSNSRTAAEDSYGNATFKEISLEGIEIKLKDELIAKIPADKKRIIQSIFNYLSINELETSKVIDYLIALEDSEYNSKSIGKNLYQLDLLPDEDLLENEELIFSRLNFNQNSINLLSSFNRPLYDRINELPIEQDTLQKDFIDFFRSEKEVKSQERICELISSSYPNLSFDKWSIPNLKFDKVNLFINEIRSTDFSIEEGRKVLKTKENVKSNITIRYTTNPSPKNIENLKFFKIVLMSVDGGSGEEVTTLRKVKNSNANSPYREAKIELNPNMFDEGSYFLKVLAEDEHGNILNSNDDFKDASIQKAWELEGKNPETKKNYRFKLACDSDDFDYFFDENPEKEETQRKDKLNNVLQAFFKYNIERLKNGDAIESPLPSDLSNVWLNDEKPKHVSTFHINYSSKHNYQINLSTKLRLLENEFLKHSNQLGHINCSLSNNISFVGLQGISFENSALTDIAPKELIQLRYQLFEAIKNSNETTNGIIETSNLYLFKATIKSYLKVYDEWLSQLKSNLFNEELNEDEKETVKHFLSEIQILDLVKVKTKLPDGNSVSCLLMSPLHPLRLSWFLQLIELFDDWYQKTIDYQVHLEEWGQLEELFLGSLSPEINPLVYVEPSTFKNYDYAGELSFGWAIYLDNSNVSTNESLVPVTQQLKHYFRTLFNISTDNYVETDISKKLVVRHIKNFLIQHPYTDKLVVNLFNVGDASIFSDSFVEIGKNPDYMDIKFEVRIFIGGDSIIEHGKSLKNLLNPETNISEEAELFSQPSKNRLFPKLRFSINNINEYLQSPSKYAAHLSFLVNPFAVNVTLFKPHRDIKSFYLNGLLLEHSIEVEEVDDNIKWNRYIDVDVVEGFSQNLLCSSLFSSLQFFVAGSLAINSTQAIPSIELRLSNRDKVLLSQLHEFSDWVITFDKNLGPQFFDQPSKDGNIPFLLDYVPGEEISGISSFLTTKPSSEVLGLLGPHFEEFNLNIHNAEDEKKIKIILEDVRAVSSSLVLQLNSTKNKAFEVIGSAFTKRVLEKKGFLEEAVLVPIDLHQNIFENLSSNSKSRADNLLFSIDKDKREISISIIEIKCRKSIGVSEKEDLKLKMREQIENTILAIRHHFDPNNYTSVDRLDREIKNKEFKALLSFYIERAYRYNYLSENAYNTYCSFLQTLDNGFDLKFNQLGFIFDFSFAKRHEKEVVDDSLTFFTFGAKLIEDILDPDSDLNTTRLEEKEFDKELGTALGTNEALKPFLQRFKSKIKQQQDLTPIVEIPIENKDLIIESTSSNESDGNDNNDDLDDDYNDDDISFVPKPDSPNGIVNEEKDEVVNDTIHIKPDYDVIVGKSSESPQFGILGKSIQNKKIAIDLSETNTISLFGVQGGGKSYTIGTITEMVLKQFSNINVLPSPLAGVIFHYSESMDYEPEFTSMVFPNDNRTELQKLKDQYGAEPGSIKDVILLTPRDKIEDRRLEYPSIDIKPISFNSMELNVQDWMFLLGAVGNDSAYIKQLKSLMREQRRNITMEGLSESVEASELLSNGQKALARQKLSFAREYIDDSFYIRDILKPGRLIIVDLRDEFIVKDEALGLFVIMLNIFSGVKTYNDKHFNKFIVFDEAHKYMDNKDLTGNIVTAIREMRHKGVSIMIASQDPPSLPNEIIELSSVVLLHKFNSPQWLKHIQKSITQLSNLTPADMSILKPGEGFLWSTKASEQSITLKPIKISTRPRVTKHGGATKQATGEH
ncbi:methylation-associated defense system ATP-binding protein MAD8 [Flavobacterium gawalongense]|nr:ATP-binding protein [Flavobacterium gawalongense]